MPTGSPRAVDVLLRYWPNGTIEILDRASRRIITRAHAPTEAHALAARFRGEVWEEHVNVAGHPIAAATRLLPRSSDKSDAV